MRIENKNKIEVVTKKEIKMKIQESFAVVINECVCELEEIELTNAFGVIRDEYAGYLNNIASQILTAGEKESLYPLLVVFCKDYYRCIELFTDVATKDKKEDKIEMDSDIEEFTSIKEFRDHMISFYAECKKTAINMYGRSMLFSVIVKCYIKLKMLIPKDLDVGVNPSVDLSHLGFYGTEKLVKELDL